MTTRLPIAATSLVSFDGGVRLLARVVRPDRYRHLDEIPPHEPRIVRGGGYSYAAAGLSGVDLVVDARAFDRVLEFDEDSGTMTCEGSTTLGAIHDVATPRGWFLPVQPGYPRITVGGCIAGDVHGKNQFLDGTFRRHVRGLTLHHPLRGTLVLTPDDPAGLFDLTCGGLGLTGHIRSATLQLMRLPGRSVTLQRRAIACLDDVPDRLEECARSTSFLYTWHNLTAGGTDFGRGFLYTGDFNDEPPATAPRAPSRVTALTADDRGRWRIPLLNRATAPLFNRAYGWLQGAGPASRSTSLFDFLFPVARKASYFRLFGSAGFHEIQLLVPRSAFGAFVSDLRAALRRLNVPITLASCKLFRGDPAWLRFDGSGICVALDFPRGPSGASFAGRLDEMTLACGARPNLLKDSRLPLDVVTRAFPEYESFRLALKASDPERLFRSELSQRLLL